MILSGVRGGESYGCVLYLSYSSCDSPFPGFLSEFLSMNYTCFKKIPYVYRWKCSKLLPTMINKLLRLPHTSRLFVATNRVCLGAESISAMFENRLVHVTLMTTPYRLTYVRAPIFSQTCLNSPYTNQQVKIFRRPTKNRLVWGGL